MAELAALEEVNSQHRRLLEILANWRINLEINQNINNDEDKELIMNLSPAYQRWREETFQEGRQEGREEGNLEGQRLMVASLLSGRFGALDEELSRIITPLMQLPAMERTQLLLNLSNLSRSELLARFGEASN